MSDQYRAVVIFLVIVFVGSVRGFSDDRDSLPSGLRHFHDQTGQRTSRSSSHRQGRYRTGNRHSLYFGAGSTGFWGSSVGYGVVIPGIGYRYYGVPGYSVNSYYNYWQPQIHLPANPLVGPVIDAQRNVGERVDAIERRLQEAEANRREVQVANDAARRRAQRFIETGDKLFRQQLFLGAQQRYQSAITAAPGLAQAHYRNAYALIANKRYANAFDALRTATDLDPNLATTGILLSQLYGNDKASMNSHLEAVAQAATDNPQNGELLFLVGVFLRDSEQPDRAAKFFRRAAELQPNLSGLRDAFSETIQKGQLAEPIVQEERKT